MIKKILPVFLLLSFLSLNSFAQEKAASSWHSTKHWEFHGIGNQVVERRRRRTTHEDVEDGRTDSQSLIDGATSPIHHVALTLATKDGAP